MDRSQLYEELNYVNHSRENRKKYALLVISDPNKMIPLVMDIAFDCDDKISPRACWLLEFVARENLSSLYPFIDRFTANMSRVYQDPAVRPIAKICEYLITAYYQKKDPEIRKALNQKHKELITELCFDYLITDQKIAPKAYSASSLYLLGREFDWINQELQLILERDYPNASSGFKARARKILAGLKKRSQG